MVTHPALHLLSGPFTWEDLFLVVYCLVDDWLHHRFGSSNAPRRQRAPRPTEFADAEVLTVLLVAELCHCTRERRWLREVRASYRPLFPHLPEDSRFGRRADQARELLRQFRETVLFWADADLEPLRLLDSFPLPLCACYRIRQSGLPVREATFGRNDSKRLCFYGLHPGLWLTASGFVVDVIQAPGNWHDTRLLANYLDECVEREQSLAGQVWVMDKRFRSRKIVAWAPQRLGLALLPQQQEAPGEPPSTWQQTLQQVRKPIESMLAVLTECLGVEHLLVKTEWGLYRRTQAKATALALARYFHRALELTPLNFARYAV